MKLSFRFLLLPVLLAAIMVGAYLRSDFQALWVFGIAAGCWILFVCVCILMTRLRSDGARDGPVKGDTLVDHCNGRIRWVASAFNEDMSELRTRAKAVAGELGSSSIDQLASLFHSEHSPPSEIGQSFQGLGAWITARQFAIFEVFYNLGPASIPMLKRVAFGQYDWTQGNAIEILCRLAADGINRTEIIEELIAHLPTMREEAHIYALGPLLQQSEANNALRDVIERLQAVPEFRESYDSFRR
jgi:hypothetical protein